MTTADRVIEGPAADAIPSLENADRRPFFVSSRAAVKPGRPVPQTARTGTPDFTVASRDVLGEAGLVSAGEKITLTRIGFGIWVVAEIGGISERRNAHGSDVTTRLRGEGSSLFGAAGLLIANAAELRANPLGLPIGSQVYPLRTMLKDFPAFVKMMAEIGVTRLELCSPIGYGPEFASLADGNEIRKILANHGMKAESSHFTMGELRNGQQKSIEWAKAVGISQMITATLGGGNGGNHPTLDQVRKAADEYNKIAAVAAKADIQQGLHNEGFELSMVDGKRTYDLLFDLLDPSSSSSSSRCPRSHPAWLRPTTS